MSITSALSSAASGLAASSRTAEVVSSNLANMLTPGYARRQLELQTLGQGMAGVGVSGVTRQSDPLILSDRRQADAEIASADARAEFIGSMERVIGTPDDASSLSARVSAFEAGLISASGNPEKPQHLKVAIQRAQDLAEALNRAGKEVETRRSNADAAIADGVDQINALLGQIHEVNARIGTRGRQDQHSATLLDQRDALVDQLSEYIPVKSVSRESNKIALFTPGGALLLDGAPAKLEFAASPIVAAHMTIDNGLLSGLSINGVTVPPSGAQSPIEGGRLAALFDVRDTLSTSTQNRLDALSRDLVERFQQAGLDASRAPGSAGLFTDDGAAFVPADEVGLSQRINVNALLDPDLGGAYWRLRDGLGAAAPGSPGNGSLLSELAAAMEAPRVLAGSAPASMARTASQHAAAVSSRLAQDRLAVDQAHSFAAARQAALAELEQQNGVDSDAELRDLLLIEQAYAANARMIQTIDEMMKALLRI